MKKSTVTLIAVLLVLVVLAVVIGTWRGNNAPEPLVPTASPQTQTVPNAVTNTPVKTPAKTPAKTTYVAPKTPMKTTTPLPSPLSYVDYLTQLRANQNTCNTNAQYQINANYGTSLQSSTYTSYYNTVNGQCFVKLIGKLTPAYSATTTGYIYFRNVSKNVLVAECIDPTGTLFGDTNWSCSNKITGATMNIAAFNAQVGSYTTQ